MPQEEFDERINVGYTIESITLNKETIKKLRIMTDRRKITSAHVNHLLGILKEGTHFDSPFVVNLLTEKNVRKVIDGNHRFEAVKEWIAENEDNSINVVFCTYKDLSVHQEREVYTKWNSGRKQSSDDFIQLYAKTIPMLQAIKDGDNYRIGDVPVKIYSLNTRD